jgi:hypothetical protein
MTERLGGPALAGRLLLRLDKDGLLEPQWWKGSSLTFDVVKEAFDGILQCDENLDANILFRCLKAAKKPVSNTILQWADQYWWYKSPMVSSCLEMFAEEVAEELAGALTVWMNTDNWERFGRRIVLTGGVGIHFLSSTDLVPNCGFLSLLRKYLPPACIIERSQLTNAIERESYLFLRQ